MLDQLDDAIRSVLADITATAPSPDDVNLAPAPARTLVRSRWLLPAIAAAIVALVAGLAGLGARDRTAPVANPTSTAMPQTSVDAPTTDLALEGVLAHFPTVTAHVTNQTDGAKVVTIDHGSSYGIEVGMAVADTAGLVGMITRVEESTSEVRLITDAAYTIECEVDGVAARCQGDGDSVSIVPGSGRALPLGAAGVVRTVGGAVSLAPPDIPVGQIAATTTADRNGLVPAADLARLNVVYVIRYVPPSQVPHPPTTVAAT